MRLCFSLSMLFNFILNILHLKIAGQILMPSVGKMRRWIIQRPSWFRLSTRPPKAKSKDQNKLKQTKPLKHDAVSLDLVHLHRVYFAPPLTTAQDALSQSLCLSWFPSFWLHQSKLRCKAQHMNPLESITARFKFTQVCLFSSAEPLKMQH